MFSIDTNRICKHIFFGLDKDYIHIIFCTHTYKSNIYDLYAWDSKRNLLKEVCKDKWNIKKLTQYLFPMLLCQVTLFTIKITFFLFLLSSIFHRDFKLQTKRNSTFLIVYPFSLWYKKTVRKL